MPREDKEQEEEQKARTAYDLIRMRLDRLEKNIEKPASIPQRRDPRKPRPPPDFVRNVVGSSAAAGSAEFHIFRSNRKREMDRLDYMYKKAEEEEQDDEFQKRREEQLKVEEERTAKKRVKRQRQKEKLKQKKKKKKDAEEDSEASEESTSEEEQGAEHSSEAVTAKPEETEPSETGPKIFADADSKADNVLRTNDSEPPNRTSLQT